MADGTTCVPQFTSVLLHFQSSVPLTLQARCRGWPRGLGPWHSCARSRWSSSLPVQPGSALASNHLERTSRRRQDTLVPLPLPLSPPTVFRTNKSLKREKCRGKTWRRQRSPCSAARDSVKQQWWGPAWLLPRHLSGRPLGVPAGPIAGAHGEWLLCRQEPRAVNHR